MNLNQSEFHLNIQISGLYGQNYISEMLNRLIPDLQYHSENEKSDYLILNHLSPIDWNDSQAVSQLIERMNSTVQAVIYNGDEYPRIKSNIQIRKQVNVNRLSFGFDRRNDIQATNVTAAWDTISMDVLIHNELYGHFELPNYGRSFIYYDLCVIAIGYCELMDSEQIQKTLQNYHCDKQLISLSKMKYSTQSISSLEELIAVLADLKENNPYLPIYLVNNQKEFSIDLKELKFQVLRSFVARYYDVESMKNHLEELKQESCLLLILSNENIIE